MLRFCLQRLAFALVGKDSARLFGRTEAVFLVPVPAAATLWPQHTPPLAAAPLAWAHAASVRRQPPRRCEERVARVPQRVDEGLWRRLRLVARQVACRRCITARRCPQGAARAEHAASMLVCSCCLPAPVYLQVVLKLNDKSFNMPSLSTSKDAKEIQKHSLAFMGYEHSCRTHIHLRQHHCY